VLCASLLALVLPSSASAKVVELYVYNGAYPAGSFDGTGSVGGPAPFGFCNESLDINQATGDVYVGNCQSGGSIYKFNSAGVPQQFTALAPNTVITGAQTNSLGATVVDNSGTSTEGRIFQWAEFSDVSGYEPTGAPIGGTFPLPDSGLGDNCGGDVGPNGNLWITTWSAGIQEYTPSGAASTQGPAGGFISANGTCGFTIDSQENFYTIEWSGGQVRKWNKAGVLQDESQPGGFPGGVLENTGNEPSDLAVDSTNGMIFVDHEDHINEYDPSGALIGVIGEPAGGYPGLSGSQGVVVNETTHKLYATSGSRVDTFVQTGPITVPDVTTESSSVTETTATLHGLVDRDLAHGGTKITECHIEWGETSHYGTKLPCEPATPYLSATQAVEATITSGLVKGHEYHYRVTAANENGVQSNGGDRTFRPAGPPIISEERLSNVNTDGARISAKINPNGGDTTYYVEYGTTEAYGSRLPEPEGKLSKNEGVASISVLLSGLTPGTHYHFRVVATNANSTTKAPDHSLMTFPTNPTGVDPCPNAQVRQQTGASLLLDCRAYELASAGNTGGYDVQSGLVPGQEGFTPQPGANDRVLYSVHFGTIPGTGDPTNLGPDPYVATRGAGGWVTSYVGIPASGTPASEPFGSPLAGSSASLETFAFGGANLCKPCFSGETRSGVPVHMPNGTLVQGMKGSISAPTAEPTGYIAKPLSANGSHLVFGSKTALEADGHNGEIAIYDRNLAASTTETHVVSKTPGGETLKEEGKEIGELDISISGSRIVFGHLVSTDTAGNHYWHLYMNVEDSSKAIDLTPATTTGALYDGMSADGSKVFFTDPSGDTMTGGDGNSRADIYRADVTASGSTLHQVSTGGTGSGCNPVAGKEGPHWNSVSGATNCDVVAFAGAAGVASGSGTIYFLSPEKLDGSGTANEANLFVASPGGSPHFVATLEALSTPVRNAVYDNEVHRYSDFQVTPNGNDAAFASKLELTEFDSNGHSEVFRYDSPSNELECVSCSITGATATGDASLATGLNLTNDGRVFFTSSEPLVLRDSNGKKDVYEWEEVGGEPKQQLVSTGTSDFDSGLLSVSDNGVNAYFFTRSTLVPQDENGSLMKIYDAREGGGFLVLPNKGLCAASDECHGAGTQSSPPPQIGTFQGTGGNVPPEKRKKPCKKGFVKKHGKCVKKHPKHHKRHSTGRHG
jgi:hypothetical protein